MNKIKLKNPLQTVFTQASLHSVHLVYSRTKRFCWIDWEKNTMLSDFLKILEWNHCYFTVSVFLLKWKLRFHDWFLPDLVCWTQSLHWGLMHRLCSVDVPLERKVVLLVDGDDRRPLGVTLQCLIERSGMVALKSNWTSSNLKTQVSSCVSE